MSIFMNAYSNYLLLVPLEPETEFGGKDRAKFPA
jgi:hypothetical protein